MSCRIDRHVIEENLVILRISGRITGQDVDMLRALLERERNAVAIDLTDVLLVDREAVKLLALHESTEPNSETARPISVNGSQDRKQP